MSYFWTARIGSYSGRYVREIQGLGRRARGPHDRMWIGTPEMIYDRVRAKSNRAPWTFELRSKLTVGGLEWDCPHFINAVGYTRKTLPHLVSR